MKKTFYFIMTLSLLISTLTNAQTWKWAKQAGGQIWDRGSGVCYDPNGFIYTTGQFMDTSYFGSNIIISHFASPYFTRDIYIAKYDTLGNNIWVKKAGGSGANLEAGTSIINDNLGNIYVTGYFEGVATFDMTSVAAYSTAADIFLAKYDSNGSLIWLKHMNTGNSFFTDFYPTLGVDNLNNVYLYGLYQGVFPTNQVVFDGQTLVDTKSQSMFIAKYNSSGLKQWVSTINGVYYFPYKFDISTDGAGNSFVTGNFKDTAYFGGTSIISSGNSDMFIAKYNNTGNLSWVKKGGGNQSDEGVGVAVDFNNNVYVSGLFSGTATFGTNTITASTTEKIFLAKYDYNGTLVWVKKFGGEYNDKIACDTLGNCFLAGQYYNSSGVIIIGSDTLTGAGNPEFYISKINSAGNVTGVVQAKAEYQYYNYAEDIAVDNNGGCYTNGYFLGNSTFGQINLNCDDIGSNNILITKTSFGSLYSSVKSYNISNNLVNIYPNPSQGSLTVDFDKSIKEIWLTDLLGNIIIRHETNNQTTFNLDNLSSGTYILTLIEKDGRTTNRKIISCP